ncbi:LuxR C-terminal-related transcriptional regulator [Streptomyces sp. NPDC001530]|uniref:LuxR C-terminal-related transcriptional regulator n=1 Tax=Streptomyces sp. NPDC001530 TaxID=3364582 RepID=UPI0036CA5517
MSQAIDMPLTVSDAVGEATSALMHGRKTEHEQISQWVRRLVHRSGSGVLWIEGPAGIGKSRMLSCAAEEASLAGARVLKGAGVPSGDMTPLAPFLDALMSGAEPNVAQSLCDRTRDRGNEYWLLRSVKDRLRVLTRDKPLVLLLDDVQNCDGLTLLALRTLTERLAGEPLLWVLASRPHTDVAAVETLRRDLLAGNAAHLELTPLDTTAVAKMALDVLGPYTASAAAPYLRYTDGLPGAVHDVCERLKRSPSFTADTLSGGEGEHAVMRPVIVRRVDQLTEEGRELSLISALLGKSFTVRHLADVLDRPESALLRPLREVLTARLLRSDRDRLSFTHALVREAVAAMLPRPMRQSVRRRSVDLQLAAGVSAVTVASELGEVAEPGDIRAVQVLRTAAHELAPASPGAAAALLKRAVELTQEASPLRQRLSTDLMPLLWQAGDIGGAYDLARSVLQAPPDSVTHARACLHLARLNSQFRTSHPDAHFRHVYRRPDVPAAVKNQLLSVNLLNQSVTGDFGWVGSGTADSLKGTRGAHPVSEVTHRTLRSIASCHRQNWADALKHSDAAAVAIMDLDPVRAAALPEVALSTNWRASLLSLAGDGKSAIDLVDSGLGEAELRGREALLPLWRTTRARLLLDSGRLAEAKDELSAVRALISAYPFPYMGEAAVLHTLARAAFYTGDDTGMSLCASAAEEHLTSDDPQIRRGGAWTTALSAMYGGQEELTPRQLREALDFVRRGSVHMTCLDPADLLILVRAALDSGLRDVASSMVAFAERRARHNQPFAVLQATALHARGLLEAAPKTLMGAAERYGTARPLLRASAVEDAGRLVAGAEDASARAHFEQALDIYEACGAHRESRRARSRLRRLGIKPAAASSASDAGWRGLTPSELGVVRLVAHGATNREAAERLFLSPHTINTHVRHAFEKLGIRSRVQLARLYLQEVDQAVEVSH